MHPGSAPLPNPEHDPQPRRDPESPSDDDHAGRSALWRKRYFEAQAAAEAFVLREHGFDGLERWITANATIAAPLLAAQRAVGTTRSRHFMSRLQNQLALYESDVSLQKHDDELVLRNTDCGILRYRKGAARQGVRLTFDTPCDYCQRLNIAIAQSYAAPASVTCQLAGEGCEWRVAERDVETFMRRLPNHRATVPKVGDPPERHRAFAAASLFTRQLIFDRPYRFRTVGITGSNGKGSTASILSTLILKAGLRVGTISSPALRADCTDMVRVNGVPISADRLLAGLEAAEDRVRSFSGRAALTHYMAICIAAYEYFRECDVDVVVAETAIGGRDDAAIPFRPDICLFTNVTLEHRHVLGDTIPKIADHKSRIIGTESVVVLGEEVMSDAAAVISSYAERQGAAAVIQVEAGLGNSADLIVDRDGVRIRDGKRCPFYQHPNLRLAAEGFIALRLGGSGGLLIDLDDPPWQLFPENRFEIRERHGVEYIFDSAHNEDGYIKLLRSLSHRCGRSDISFVVGVTSRESFDSFCQVMQPTRATFVTGYHPRAFAMQQFVDLSDIDFDDEERKVGGGSVVVCGMFLAPAVKAALFPSVAFDSPVATVRLSSS